MQLFETTFWFSSVRSCPSSGRFLLTGHRTSAKACLLKCYVPRVSNVKRRPKLAATPPRFRSYGFFLVGAYSNDPGIWTINRNILLVIFNRTFCAATYDKCRSFFSKDTSKDLIVPTRITFLHKPAVLSCRSVQG